MIKKIVLALLLIPGLSGALAQTVGPGKIINVIVAPSGSCVPGAPVEVMMFTGTVYTCQSMTWGSIGGGSGALFPSNPGIVWNTSTTASRNAAAGDIETLLGGAYLSSSGGTLTGNLAITNSAAAPQTLLSMVGSAGSWGGFEINESGNSIVMETSNQFQSFNAFMDTNPSTFVSGNFGSFPSVWGMAYSCATVNPNTGCLGGMIQAPSSGVMNFSADYHGTNAATFNFVGVVTASQSESAPEHLLTGTIFSVSGCGTPTSLAGGSTGGTFTASTASCTPVITTNITAPHGYTCWMNDLTTTSVKFQQTGSTTTTATFTATGTLGATDNLNFGCLVY